MNKLTISVQNMVDRLLIISDRERFPESINKENENDTPLSLELFRKLKLTSIEVITKK